MKPRLTDAAFESRICVDWARRMNIFFDLESVHVVTTDVFSGRGIFAKKPLGRGDFFAVVPCSSMLRAVDLFAKPKRYFADLITAATPPPSIDPSTPSAALGSYDSFGDPIINEGDAAPAILRCTLAEEADLAEAFGRGFHVISRGSERVCDDLPVTGLLDSTRPTVPVPQAPTGDEQVSSWLASASLPPMAAEEREWWLLALVLALERRRGVLSSWREYIEFALPDGLMMDARVPFQHQLPLLVKGRLPSPSTSMKPPERNESPWIPPLTPADFTVMRRAVIRHEQVRSGYAWRIAAIFNANLRAVVGGPAPGDPPARRTATFMRPSDLRWAMDVVSSRANNFSLVGSTERPRPYGLSAEPVPGACATLCPIFDLLNHSQTMNVLVADVALQREAAGDPPEDGANGSLILGALSDVAAGEQLTYIYNAPTYRAEMTGYRTLDVAACIARWGFVPEPPLS